MEYDVVIIGGGPSGMMAAGRAGELGARVLMLEKNDRLGVKLLMTGNGRCNITNNILEPRLMAESFGRNGKFLISAMNKFGVAEVINFFEQLGVKTKVEKNNQVFPVSDQATEVLGALINYLKKSKVEVKFNAEVNRLITKENKIVKVILKSGEEIMGDKFVIATGGKAYPITGSTGDAYKWLKSLGHSIIEPKPTLTPVILKDKLVKELEGLSLKAVKITILKAGKKIASEVGDAIFTADGMSGPLIFKLSKKISESMPGKINLQLDFFPELDFEAFDLKLQNEFYTGSSKQLKNSLDKIVQPKLRTLILKLLGINQEKSVNSISREERIKLARLLKEFSFEIYGLKGFDRAMVTAGGVTLSEVDPKTMRSKLIENLYLVGEVLDLDGPTGGYNLQVCWSTGYAAGDNVN